MDRRIVSFHLSGDALWQHMERAVEKIRQRLERTALALEQAGIPYAIIGGNAVRAWVAQADEAAVGTTRDVDILLRRSDWPAAVEAMERRNCWTIPRVRSCQLKSRTHFSIGVTVQALLPGLQ